MALIDCPECGEEVSEKAEACPNCGAPIRPHSGGSLLSGIAKAVGLGVVVLAAVFYTIGLFDGSAASSDPPEKGEGAVRVEQFRDALEEVDPSGAFVLDVEAEQDLVWVEVSDVWYELPCYQRERIAENLRDVWREAGGSNVVVEDRAGETLADFQLFGDVDIEGCQ